MRGRLHATLMLALALGGIVVLAFARPVRTVTPENEARKSLDAFNQEFVAACVRMDHKADAEFWAEDGVDLLPGLDPMIGKAKISAWLDSLTPQLAGAKMIYCTVDWKDIQIHGDLAYEWGINRQKIEFPPPKKPFEGNGKILLILKRQADGSWKVVLEAWNGSPPPQEKG
jgi:ketosteroid isomerase-like protein